MYLQRENMLQNLQQVKIISMFATCSMYNALGHLDQRWITCLWPDTSRKVKVCLPFFWMSFYACVHVHVCSCQAATHTVSIKIKSSVTYPNTRWKVISCPSSFSTYYHSLGQTGTGGNTSVCNLYLSTYCTQLTRITKHIMVSSKINSICSCWSHALIFPFIFFLFSCIIQQKCSFIEPHQSPVS